MPQCEKITVDISQDSPVFALYQKMKEEFGVTDEVFDRHGYYEVNYNESGKPPTPKGVEDCYVGPADVLDLSYDHPKKHRKVIEESLGKQMPWPLTDENSAYPFNPQMKAFSEGLTRTAGEAISKIDEILQAKGLEKGSAEYQELTAVCIYHFAKFPTARTWPGLEDDRKNHWIQTTSALTDAGLGEFREYLLNNGGLGLWFNSKYVPTMFSTTGLETLMWSGGTGHNYLLYGLYDMAGLKPQFVELEPFMQKSGAANTVGLSFRFDNIAVKVGDEYFFPNKEEPVKESFYPMALRHLLFNDLYLSIMQKSLVSGEQVEVFDVMGQLKRSLDYGDDLTSSSCALRTLLTDALSSEGDNEAAKAVIDAERFLSSGSDACLMFGGMTMAALKEVELSERFLKKLADSQVKDSRMAGLLFLAIFNMENNDNKAAIKDIEAALEIWPDNPQALFFAGVALSKSEGKDLQRGEEMLNKVITSNSKTSDTYSYLGYIHARQGKYEEAANDLSNALKLQPKEPLKSFYLLGWSLWNADKKDDAKAAWAQMIPLCDPLKIIQADKDGAKSMFNDIKKVIDEFPLTPEMLQDQTVADIFGMFLSRTGDALIYHDELPLAKEAFLKALDLKPSAKMEAAIRWKLALIYQQLGETDKALLEVGRSIERR